MSGNTHYAATPTFPAGTDVPGALNYVDGALAQMVQRLAANGQLASTRIIITAKHGQSPINPASLQKIGHAVTGVLGKAGIEIALNTDDDVALVWLKNQAQTGAAVTALTTSPGKAEANVESVLSGSPLASAFGNPLSNSRTPDLIVQPTLGTIYSKSTKKVAEHGGFAEPDTHVALLVADGARWGASGALYDSEPVLTTQIAPTILRTLGLNPNRLDAVRAEGTPTLPGIGF
jgi:arylsulfatase A-like enzyme